ncbi:DUF4394 domain-containing protein [Sphingobacterium sp. lm-10]|uniref:DUF4394 domain-containing protein n=1 Tax=Sphingobacterium sp. lm-10 TaxID=2944904 RepID=UPI0020215BCA|nr:DUF4394 domain-containing protein [Sphingobacterium sp. lm-10]MCL7987021.1 DUF4394 domain-containing protein [Sphingobacterium sp. lm-10]
MKKRSTFSLATALLACAVATSSCSDNNTIDDGIVGPNVEFFAIDGENHLIRYNAQNVQNPTSEWTITGTQANERILGIDYRPATGQLYAVGTSNRIYTLNTQTGAATAIGLIPFTPGLDAAEVGFDFNPTVDRIRLVTANGQNLRLHPETGVVAAVDGSLNKNGVRGGKVTAAAYTNNTANATTTQLFVIDVETNKLYLQNPPNDGTLVEIGDLGLNITAAGGFDISSDGRYIMASLEVDGRHSLYSINLETGRATKATNNFSKAITGLAFPTM